MPLQMIIANLKREMADFHWWEVLYWAHKTSLLSQQSQLNITIIVWCKFCTVMMHRICKKVTCMVLITQTVCKYLFLLSFWMEWCPYWAPDIIHWENYSFTFSHSFSRCTVLYKMEMFIHYHYRLYTSDLWKGNRYSSDIHKIICDYMQLSSSTSISCKYMALCIQVWFIAVWCCNFRCFALAIRCAPASKRHYSTPHWKRFPFVSSFT